MWRHLLAALICCLPAAGSAQQALTVTSGEHAGFTRLVTPLPKGAAWHLEHQGQTLRLTLSGPPAEFDLDAVFSRITRDRISAVSGDPSTLSITLACDCRVAPFETAAGYLALDITSPGVTRPVAFVARTSVPDPPETLAATTAPNPPSETAPRGPLPPLPQLVPRDVPALARAPSSAVDHAALNEIQDRLARELGSAATRGILTPMPGAAFPAERRAQIDVQALPQAAAPPAPLTDRLEGLVNNMRITSSTDIPNLGLPDGDAQSVSGISCPRDSELDIASWTDGSPFHQQSGTGRRQLYGEFDKLDPDAALALARTFIHFGFGAEALQVLRLDPELARANALLLDIAHIMEVGHAPKDSPLRSLLDCDSDVALWAILAREDLEIARRVNPTSALLALNKLPVHLRRFLAPALSRRLLSHGDTDAAATALRNLERLPSPLPASARLAQANIALDEGDVGAAHATLADVIDDNSEQSPEALITLVETQLQANQPIDHETAGLIEAYAKELNGSALGPELRRAHVLALVKSGQFDRAFQASAELGGTTEDEPAVELRLRLLEELTASADDIVFLDHVFEQSDRDIDRLPVRPKLALATRLVDLGFAAQAERVVASIPARPRIDVRQILAARIAVALGQPARAEAALLGMTGQQVDQLRAEALQQAGQHAEAYTLLRALEQEDAASQAALLAEDWSVLDLQDDTVFGPILALSEEPAPTSPQVDGMLARTATALEQSEAARQALTTMLQAPQVRIDNAEAQN